MTARQQRTVRYNPETQRHSWERAAVPHWRRCRWCLMSVQNKPNGRRWYQEWHWNDYPERGYADNLAGGSIPRCPGPVVGAGEVGSPQGLPRCDANH